MGIPYYPVELGVSPTSLQPPEVHLLSASLGAKGVQLRQFGELVACDLLSQISDQKGSGG